ncbi:MAG: zinc ribbon domain-containing protein [Candidatus Marinimicrobia bacterium]|nr:zinc ribbon domain-containing protein [Candidatus Neomarinimicrobiota bacterium]MCF7880168.1 zinc ribbon domain-containing protein [Candidatus Neomarinimicrobiota bacterium]
MMPIYEYRCPHDHLFEKLVDRTDPNPVCPECGCPGQRLFSPPAFRFKGSGFHSTDYTRHGPKDRKER